LLIDSSRTPPKEDPTSSFIIPTMGMFIEALSLLAANHRHKLEYELFHEPAWYAGPFRGEGTGPSAFAKLRLGADDRRITLTMTRHYSSNDEPRASRSCRNLFQKK
jgi:hypothetical protein